MKSKFFALLALVMVFAVICTMGIAVFADDSAPADDTSTSEDSVDDTATSEDATDDTSSETTGDASDSSTTTGTEEKKEETKEPTWWDNYNQIIGWILAAIILVAIVFVSFWWIKSGFKPSKK